MTAHRTSQRAHPCAHPGLARYTGPLNPIRSVLVLFSNTRVAPLRVVGAALLATAACSDGVPVEQDVELPSQLAAPTGKFSIQEARQLLDQARLSPLVKGAPVGMPDTIAAGIISKNPDLVCEKVTDAYRVQDKSIVAKCSGGQTYRVGEMFEMGQRAMACREISSLTQQRPC